MLRKFGLLFIFTFFITAAAYSQDILNNIRITGNYELDAQYYTRDSIIGADKIPNEKILSNGFLYLNINVGNFNAGMRYEEYLNPILGFDPNYRGQGIPYRFIEFNSGNFMATAGSFYEQFGSGMILRAYEERQLGIDNAIEGLRAKYRPTNGVEITGLIGTQRMFWTLGPGIIRGGDMNITVNDIFENLLPASMQLKLGGSVVSRYQADNDPTYNIPENALAYSTRLSLSGETYAINTEFAGKNNDPSVSNRYNFNPGTGLMVSAAYFPEGFGASLEFHRIDNMDFRSDRNQKGNVLNINFLPPITKQHVYRLETIYPYATQLNGEIGLQGEVTYTIPKGTSLGGEYGTTLALNYSRVHSLDTTHTLIDTLTGNAFKYDSPFPGIGKRLFYQDINLEITKRWTKEFKSNFALTNIIYDKDVLREEGAGVYGKVNATIAIAELSYKFSPKMTLRTEFQHLWAKQDSVLIEPDNESGNWAMVLGELTLAPHWYLTLMDEYNYGNPFEEKKLHYLTAAAAYVFESTRIELRYGRQRGGLLCVGGVCRQVPPSNGYWISITSSF